LNFRAKLWKWGKTAGSVMTDMVALCDLVIANEEDAKNVFGIQAPGIDVNSGKVEAERFLPVCEQLSGLFPRLSTIAITLRGSLSAGHNTWSGALWNKSDFLIAPVYDITEIVDRVGAGDGFAAGLIYGLIKFGKDRQHALDFAVAASALKHSIYGDFNLVSTAEVEALINGNVSGRVNR